VTAFWQRGAPEYLKGGEEMVVWKLKGCPRCGGDVFIDREFDVWYAQCLQCSHRREVDAVDEPKKQPVTAGVERSKTGR